MKQQENEREKEAIQALSRAVEYDPTLLDAWIALAVSYTNESQPGGAYDAIERWINQNERYQNAIGNIKQGSNTELGGSARCKELVDTLVTMVRSVSEVDADTQVALAVLLNTAEVKQSSLISVLS